MISTVLIVRLISSLKRPWLVRCSECLEIGEFACRLLCPGLELGCRKIKDRVGAVRNLSKSSFISKDAFDELLVGLLVIFGWIGNRIWSGRIKK